MPTISRRYQVHALQSSSSSYSVIGFLAESDFLEDLGHIIKCFDKTTKLRFRNADEPQFVKFGSTLDNDEDCNIRYGQLKMTGWAPVVTSVKLSTLMLLTIKKKLYSTDVASFFKPSIQCIIDSVQEQRKKAHKKFTVSIIYLLSTLGGHLIFLIGSMSFLWEDLLLATGSTNKSLKFWQKRGTQSFALITTCKDSQFQVASHVWY